MPTVGLRELAILDEASRMLDNVTSLEDVKTIRDKAEAARTYARAAQLGLDLQNRAAELKLRAERKAGHVLASLNLRGGDRRSKGHQAPLKLDELGISRDQSKRWQRIATVSEQDFCAYLQAANATRREVTSAALLRMATKSQGDGAKPNLHRDGTRQLVATRQSHAACRVDSDELILELINHFELLANILRPVYEGGALDFKLAERRIIGRLIGDIGDLVRQLRSQRLHSENM